MLLDQIKIVINPANRHMVSKMLLSLPKGSEPTQYMASVLTPKPRLSRFCCVGNIRVLRTGLALSLFQSADTEHQGSHLIIAISGTLPLTVKASLFSPFVSKPCPSPCINLSYVSKIWPSVIPSV